MAQAATLATETLVGILRAADGAAAQAAQLALTANVELPPLAADQIRIENISPELVERATGRKYPQVYIYCERISNLLREKFRRFSGEAQVIIEVRVSQDRLEGLERALQLYVEAITEVLDRNRGEWTEGAYYSGGYQVSFGSVRSGGTNYLQAAKIQVTLDVSLN